MSELSSFEIKMPTDEEIHASCLERYERIKGTLMDQWPQEWLDVSIPTRFFELSQKDVERIISIQDGADPAELTVLACRLDVVMDWRDKFVRLNTRSPKDVTSPGLPFTCAGRQIISWLASSMRTFEDLCLLSRVKQPAFVVLREQTFIPEETEFRCFVKDGEFTAVSQYFYDRSFQMLQDAETRETLQAGIDTFWREHIHPHTDMTDYVFDVFFSGEGPRLLEVNPYGLSDPCAATTYEAAEKGGFFFVPDSVGTVTDKGG